MFEHNSITDPVIKAFISDTSRKRETIEAILNKRLITSLCVFLSLAKHSSTLLYLIYLLVIIYTVIYLASPNVSIRFLPTHFICEGPGSFHNFIIPISYCLHCNLSCFTQCVIYIYLQFIHSALEHFLTSFLVSVLWFTSFE